MRIAFFTSVLHRLKLNYNLERSLVNDTKLLRFSAIDFLNDRQWLLPVGCSHFTPFSYIPSLPIFPTKYTQWENGHIPIFPVGTYH
jgi:hypothetical protein